jgi:ribosomal protein S18 acetylase RimI-like enzyme
MEITIRRAVKEDCSRLLELVKELAVYEKAPNEVTVTLEHFIESGFGENPVWWAFVASPLTPLHGVERGKSSSPTPNLAETGISHSPLTNFAETGISPSPLVEKGQGDEVFGFALYYIRYSTWKGQRMYLEDLIVTEKARGKGIGKMLMDRLIVEANEKKFTGIMWQVLEWNKPAINFYKKYQANFDSEWVNCSISFK